MKLYWHPVSIIPRRVRIAFREKGVAYEEVEVDLPGGAHRGPEFRRLNPFAQVPVLQDGDLVIAESVAILEYLEERFPTPALLPSDPASRAVTRQFILWAGDYINPAWEAWMAPWFKGVPADDPSVRKARDVLAAHLDVVEARLQERTWLIGTTRSLTSATRPSSRCSTAFAWATSSRSGRPCTPGSSAFWPGLRSGTRRRRRFDCSMT